MRRPIQKSAKVLSIDREDFQDCGRLVRCDGMRVCELEQQSWVEILGSNGANPAVGRRFSILLICVRRNTCR